MSSIKKAVKFFKYETSAKSIWEVLILLCITYHFTYFISEIGRVVARTFWDINKLREDFMLKIILGEIYDILTVVFIVVIDAYFIINFSKRKNRGVEKVKNSNYLFDNGYDKKSYSVMMFLKLIILGVMMSFIIRYIAIYFNYNINRKYSEYFSVAFFSAVIIAPLVEEFLYRKIIFLGMIKNGYAKWQVILLSSIIFGYVHGNVSQFIVGVVMGIFLAYILYHTGKLLYPIVLHAVYNASNLLIGRFIYTYKSTGAMTMRTNIYFAISLVLLGIVMLMIIKSDKFVKVTSQKAVLEQ